jgi:hypothetical protein
MLYYVHKRAEIWATHGYMVKWQSKTFNSALDNVKGLLSLKGSSIHVTLPFLSYIHVKDLSNISLSCLTWTKSQIVLQRTLATNSWWELVHNGSSLQDLCLYQWAKLGEGECVLSFVFIKDLPCSTPCILLSLLMTIGLISGFLEVSLGTSLISVSLSHHMHNVYFVVFRSRTQARSFKCSSSLFLPSIPFL